MNNILIPGMGKVTLQITILNGKVVIQFGRKIDNFHMDAEFAAQVSKAIAEAARDLARMQGLIISNAEDH